MGLLGPKKIKINVEGVDIILTMTEATVRELAAQTTNDAKEIGRLAGELFNRGREVQLLQERLDAANAKLKLFGYAGEF